MAISNFQLANTVTSFVGGVDSVTGIGAITKVTIGGTWLVGEELSLTFTDSLSGTQSLVGAGWVTEVEPTFCFTYENKVYALGGATVYVSAIADPTTWNDPNGSGNGFITLSNWLSTSETLVAASSYQGGLALFTRNTVQIWTTSSNLANWAVRQVLPNIGTMAPLSVQSLGDLDVIFLSDTGIRSLRARDITLNAFVNDIGSPIDQIIQRALLVGDGTSACAAIEPTSNRYMLFLNGIIYVLSYFPSNKVLAWSTYTPVDSAGGVFIPQQMLVFNGQIWFYGLDGNGNSSLYQYGGVDNNTYDKTKAKWQTGFFDAKTPGTVKNMKSISVAVNGSQGGVNLTNPDTWSIYCSMNEATAGDPTVVDNPAEALWTLVYKGQKSSFDKGTVSYNDKGTHFSVYGQSNGDGGVNGSGGPAIFSMLVAHEFPGNEEG